METQVQATTQDQAEAPRSKSWIGVDLDGTLAKYDGWKGPTEIGEPVPEMVEFVKRLVTEGHTVRIFTARVAPATILANKDDLGEVVKAIYMWCVKHLGFPLDICCQKDLFMMALYDDRCVQIVPNEGRRADGLPL